MKGIRRAKRVEMWRKSAILALTEILVLSILLTGSGTPDRLEIKRLLIDRAGIIQMVWYSSVTPEQGETMLKEIEVHPLLGEDVAWLREAEAGMGFSYVMDMDILDLERTSVSARGNCYVAEILWELEEYNQHISEVHTYRIRTVRDLDGTMKIAELEPI